MYFVINCKTTSSLFVEYTCFQVYVQINKEASKDQHIRKKAPADYDTPSTHEQGKAAFHQLANGT